MNVYSNYKFQKSKTFVFIIFLLKNTKKKKEIQNKQKNFNEKYSKLTVKFKTN